MSDVLPSNEMKIQVSVRTAAVIVTLASIGALIVRDRTYSMPLQSEPYTKAKLDEYVNAGRPVILTISANWTLTTQVNYSLVSKSQAIKNACWHTNTAFLRADWTRKSVAVTQLMDKNEISSVPATIIYQKTSTKPKIFLDYPDEKLIVDTLLEGMGVDE